jgi:peptidoglycan-N-acetylglucosamine deacetylase
MTWSADFPADDWTKITPAQVLSRALQRIEANGKGILLLHDIQAKTVEALPALLHELKRRGYHIVHVVPAAPDRAKTATVPSQWMMHSHGRLSPGSSIETEGTAVLPVPNPNSFGTVQPFDARPALAAMMHMFRPGQVPQPPYAVWPRGFSGSQAALADARSLLPAPNPMSFSYPEASPTPWLQGNASLVAPPEADPLAMVIRRSLLEIQPPDDSADATQSITATPPLAPRDPVSTARIPHGAFP